MDVNTYLNRIHLATRPSLDFDGLRTLQTAHLLAVPFENLDIVPLHRQVKLDEPSLWEKIVINNRGGFCYELNGGFAWLLKQIGFEVTYLNGRVYSSRDGNLGIEFDHLALLVGIGGQEVHWLADVGFGDSFVEPLVLSEAEQVQGLRAYRLEQTGKGYVVWQRDTDESWARLYFFDLVARSFPADYEAACAYHCSSPMSSFTRQSTISLLTPQGRVTLQENRLIITAKGVRREKAVQPDEWPRLLKEHFGVVL